MPRSHIVFSFRAHRVSFLTIYLAPSLAIWVRARPPHIHPSVLILSSSLASKTMGSYKSSDFVLPKLGLLTVQWSIILDFLWIWDSNEHHNNLVRRSQSWFFKLFCSTSLIMSIYVLYEAIFVSELMRTSYQWHNLFPQGHSFIIISDSLPPPARIMKGPESYDNGCQCCLKKKASFSI